MVSRTPSASRCSLATFSSRYLGSTCTPSGYCSVLVNSSTWAITWLVKLLDITKLGWPVAFPRLSSRPSDSTITECPSAKTHSSTCGLIETFLIPGSRARPAMSISLSKCPMLPTIAWCFIWLIWAAVMILKLPVALTKMSALATTSSRVATWKPSMAACSAQIGSISVMMTRAPWPRSDSAQPLPTSP